MKPWQRWTVAVPAVLLCVAATQWAVRGRHDVFNNVAYLGTERAVVEAVGESESTPRVGS